MISVAICDDFESDILNIRNVIDKYYKNKVIVEIFSRGEKLLDSNKFFDIVFLDIELADENGIEIGNKIKEKYYQTIIIYVTNYNSYYSDAFSVHAYQYILKPFKENLICKVIEEAIRHITNIRSQNTVSIDINNELVNLELRKIIYFEFVDRKVKVVSQNGTNYLRISLKSVYDKVKDYDFEMPHKAFIVNFFYVKGIKNNEILLENLDTILIAQKRAAIFKKEFYNFLHKVYYVL